MYSSIPSLSSSYVWYSLWYSSSFLKVAKNDSATALSSGVQGRETDCVISSLFSKRKNSFDVYWIPESLWNIKFFGFPLDLNDATERQFRIELYSGLLWCCPGSVVVFRSFPAIGSCKEVPEKRRLQTHFRVGMQSCFLSAFITFSRKDVRRNRESNGRSRWFFG